MQDMENNPRWERIQKLLKELEYEIVRGMMEREIPERIGTVWTIPTSSTYENGVVECRFETQPIRLSYNSMPNQKLRVVE